MTPADAFNSNTVAPSPSPFNRTAKPKYPHEPLTYLKRIVEGKGMDLETALPIMAGVGDAAVAWAGDDNAKQVYLDAVSQALSDYLDIGRPAPVEARNAWADSYLIRHRFVVAQIDRLTKLLGIPYTEAGPAVLLALAAGLTDVFVTEDDLIRFPGSQDHASKKISAFIEVKQMTPKKTQWTKDHDLQVEKLAAKHGIALTQVLTMEHDILHGEDVEKLAINQSPDSIILQINNGVASWARQWLPQQPSLLDRPSDEPSEGAKRLEAIIDEDDELTAPSAAELLAGAKMLEDKLSAENGNGAKVNTEATPLNDTPSKPIDTPAIEAKAAIEPIAEVTPERIVLNEEHDLDGREYTMLAAWQPNQWSVTLKTFVRFADEQQKIIQDQQTGYLRLSKPDAGIVFDWQMNTPTASTVTQLRDECHKLVEESFGLPGKDYETTRSEWIMKAFQGMTGQGMLGAWQSFGRIGVMQRVTRVCLEHKNQEAATLVERHQAAREQAEKTLAIIEPSAMTGVAISHRDVQPLGQMKLPTEYELKLIEVFARSAANSKLYPNITNYDQAFTIIWRGFELGVSFGAALEKIWIIKGRPYPGTELLLAAVHASKKAHRFDVVGDEKQCTVTAQRSGQDRPTIVTFTFADAVKAGLTSDRDENSNWAKYPKKMLKWRAVRDAIQTVFPDVAAGVGLSIDDDDELAPAA